MAFPRWGGVLPPIPPKGPKCSPPRSPPLWGGAIEIFILENSGSAPPQAPKLPPIWTILEQSPPHCGGEHPKIDDLLPPTVGGSTAKFQKCPKNPRCDGSPPSSKNSTPNDQDSPHLVCSFCHFCSPLAFWGGGETPRHFRCSPPLWRGLDTPTGSRERRRMVRPGGFCGTMKEIVESKKKRDYRKSLEHDTQTQADYIENKYGPGPEPDTSIDEFGNVIDEYGEIIE